MNRSRYFLVLSSLLLAAATVVQGQDGSNEEIFRLPPTEDTPAEPTLAGPEITPRANPDNFPYRTETIPAAAGPSNDPPPAYTVTPPPLQTPPLQTPPLLNSSEELPPPTPSSTSPTAPPEEIPPGDASAEAVGQVLGPESFWYSFWDPWEGNVELGMNGTLGNTETFNIRVGSNAKYTTETRIHSFQAVYLEKSVGTVNTAQSLLLDGRVEWPMNDSQWNMFVHGLTEYDQFKAFEVRLSADAGVGFEWIQNERTKFLTRAGLAVSREVGGPDDAIIPEYLAGLEFTHCFSDSHKFSFKSDYYPAIEDVNSFRINTQASWEMAVAPDWGLSLKFSVIDRYDSTPHGAKPNDLDYSTLVIWGF